MSTRRQITILRPDGRRYRLRRNQAARLLRSGEADIVSLQPPVLRLVSTPEYDEERRHLSGRLVNRTYPERVLKPKRRKEPPTPGNRQIGKARVIRTRRPRRAVVPPDAMEREMRQVTDYWLKRRGYAA